MCIRTGLLHALVLLAATGDFGHAADEDVEFYLRHDDFSQTRLSPTGKYLSAVVPRDDTNILAVIRIDNGEILSDTRFSPNHYVGDVWWVSEERLIFEHLLRNSADQTEKVYFGELYGTNADGTGREYVFGYDAGGSGTGTRIRGNTSEYGWAEMVDPLVDDPDRFLIQVRRMAERVEARSRIYEVDTKSNNRKQLGTSPEAGARIIADSHGRPRFAVALDAEGRWRSYRRDELIWVELEEFGKGGLGFIPINMSRKRDVVFGIQNLPLGAALVEFDVARGEARELLRSERYDIRDVLTLPDTGEPLGVLLDSPIPEYVYIDPQAPIALVHREVVASFPGRFMNILDMSADGGTWLIEVSSDRQPGELYLFDRETRGGRFVLRYRKGVEASEMAPKKPIEFESRDGLPIEGYLTLPLAASGKTPLVVLPHGGPAGIKDRWEFEGNVQLLASRGYAVLQINYRGSGGYGNDFFSAGYGEWGRKVQHDIIDGTRWALANHPMDADRVCIFGISFGAYSALRSSILAPDLFECAIGFSGLYDLDLNLREADYARSRRLVRRVERMMGDEKTRNAYSIVDNADQLSVPLLLIHGGKDERTPIENVESLEKALKGNDISYELHVEPREGHGFSDLSNRVKAYRRILGFLDKHIGQSSRPD